MPPDELEVAANRAFDEALDGMGADVCVFSVDLAIDEIAADLGVKPGDDARVRAMLRERFGLAVHPADRAASG
jgi:CO/xanthine dehydrogenase Mo-binding subunit